MGKKIKFMIATMTWLLIIYAYFKWKNEILNEKYVNKQEIAYR